jgi:hypothetical protein
VPRDPFQGGLEIDVERRHRHRLGAGTDAALAPPEQLGHRPSSEASPSKPNRYRVPPAIGTTCEIAAAVSRALVVNSLPASRASTSPVPGRQYGRTCPVVSSHSAGCAPPTSSRSQVVAETGDGHVRPGRAHRHRNSGAVTAEVTERDRDAGHLAPVEVDDQGGGQLRVHHHGDLAGRVGGQAPGVRQRVVAHHQIEGRDGAQVRQPDDPYPVPGEHNDGRPVRSRGQVWLAPVVHEFVNGSSAALGGLAEAVTASQKWGLRPRVSGARPDVRGHLRVRVPFAHVQEAGVCPHWNSTRRSMSMSDLKSSRRAEP